MSGGIEEEEGESGEGGMYEAGQRLDIKLSIISWLELSTADRAEPLISLFLNFITILHT